MYTSLELASQDDSWDSFDLFSGFFEAPEDGDYQFHMACDDSCSFHMSVSDPANPAALESLISRSSYTSFRNWEFTDNSNTGTVFSEWQSLTGGTKYYYEARLAQGSGSMHLSVGVEVAPSSGTHAWPKQTRQQMNFGARHTLIRDTLIIRVQDIDEMYFWFAYTDMDTGEYVPSDDIQAGCSADDMKKGIKEYYEDRFGTAPTVSKECFGIDGIALGCDTEIYTDGYCTDKDGVWMDCRDSLDGRTCLDVKTGDEIDCDTEYDVKECRDTFNSVVDCATEVDAKQCFAVSDDV